jgi:hypothetical protein
VNDQVQAELRRRLDRGDELEVVVRNLQTKVSNQANEINDLSRKLESAQRVNRGLQRKKDIRLNIIDELREIVYEDAVIIEDLLVDRTLLSVALLESDVDFIHQEEELNRAYAVLGAVITRSVTA